MKIYTKQDEFKIMGKGLVITVNIPQDQELPKLKEIVMINNLHYSVRGVEYSRILTYPTKRSTSVALLVRELENDDKLFDEILTKDTSIGGSNSLVANLLIMARAVCKVKNERIRELEELLDQPEVNRILKAKQHNKNESDRWNNLTPEQKAREDAGRESVAASWR